MHEQGITLTRLSELTGIPQGRISEYINGKHIPTKTNLDLLFGVLGRQVSLEPIVSQPQMGRCELRNWMLHRSLSSLLPQRFPVWKPKLLDNIDRLLGTNKGGPHIGNIHRWLQMIERDDVDGLRTTMVDPGRDGQEMREVGPFTGLMPQDLREQMMRELGR